MKHFLLPLLLSITLFSCSNEPTNNTPMDALVLSAKITAKPGKVEELEKELKALIEPTRAEQGCLSYNLYTSRKEAGVFLFFESWASRTEWEAHMKTDHLKAFFAKEKELIADIEIAEWKE